MLPLLRIQTLPSIKILVFLTILASSCYWLHTLGSRILAYGLIGFIWAVLRAKQLLLPLEYTTEKPTTVVAKVVGINIAQNDRRYLLQLLAISGRTLFYWEKFKVLAYWSVADQQIKAGQIWKLNIKLRPAHARLNQGGWDGQQWLACQRQLITGRILHGARLLNPKITLRQHIVDGVLDCVQKWSSADLLLALIFGERARLSSAKRNLLQQSGTFHLVAISGLHISLAALLGWWFVRLLQLILPQRMISPTLPLWVGWLCATVYTWLSGGNPPALRAWLMLSITVSIRTLGYYWRLDQLLLRVFALLLLYDPILLLDNSFWLSFSVVAILIFWHYFIPLSPKKQHKKCVWRVLLAPIYWQTGLFLLLVPLQANLFHGVSLSSLFANLFAVPLVSLCIMPVSLLALLTIRCTFLSNIFWKIAHYSVLLLLKWLAILPSYWVPLSAATQGLCYVGWIGVFTWRLALWRTNFSLLLAVALMLLAPLGHRFTAEWTVEVLDVGHGLAIVIQRFGKALLYDVGVDWPGGSIADRVILPYLHWRGVQLNGVILSHQDRDHRGGWPVIRKHYPDIWWRSSSIEPGALPCKIGEKWQWQGLFFEVLWPPNLVERANNNDSCTLRIDDGKHQVLLTGDIENLSQEQLVAIHPHKLAATVVLVPHHGSRTSSSQTWLAAVNPKVALVSVARYNPWHLPSSAVKSHYLNRGISWYSTAELGQISVRFRDMHWQVLTYRHHLKPRWYNQLFIFSNEDQ